MENSKSTREEEKSGIRATPGFQETPEPSMAFSQEGGCSISAAFVADTDLSRRVIKRLPIPVHPLALRPLEQTLQKYGYPRRLRLAIPGGIGSPPQTSHRAYSRWLQ